MNITKVGLRILMAIMIMAGGVVTGRAGGQARPEAGTTERVSVASGGEEGNAESGNPAISEDGNYVAFSSGATNLAGSDLNGYSDVFIHDRQSGETFLVSVANDGSQGNSYSTSPSVSSDGRYVAFESYASNLVAGDLNETTDVFIRDRLNLVTIRVSVASDGNEANGESYADSISGDGLHIAFTSEASNLVAGDTNNITDVFVHDRNSGETSIISVASDGTLGNELSWRSTISANGVYVAFESHADNLVSGDNNGQADIFLHDRQNGVTSRVSVDSSGMEANSGSYRPAISSDGRYITFYSWASDLVEGDTNNTYDVFVHDRISGETSRVSIASDGTEGNDQSRFSDISADGRFIVFESLASSLVEGDNNATYDIFKHDRVSGVTTLASLNSDGTQGDDASYLSVISGNGCCVSFQSDATNLVVGDNNGFSDVFVHDDGEASPTFSISGQVTDGNGDPLSGVEISTDSGEMTTTGADGYYTISDLITGTYTITPTALNYAFAPITRTVSVPPDATGQDFVGELIAYSISGQVLDDTGDPLMGVVMATNDGLTATTGLDGNYLFPEVVAGSYTVTAVLEGYTFTPTMRIVNLPPDAIGQDFVGELLTYIIAGRVADADGNSLPGVRISASDAYSATTGQQGYYGIAGVLPGTYTVTASLEGYTFEPSWRTVSVPPNAMGQYFTGKLITYAISGRVIGTDGSPLAGVSISAGAEYSATTDISGTYTISDVIPGTYTVTAMLEGYTFTPISRTVSVPPEAVGQDFTAVMEVIFAWLPMVVK
jgi:Tol biopolymer transport system component